jgi:hypothetical protein
VGHGKGLSTLIAKLLRFEKSRRPDPYAQPGEHNDYLARRVRVAHLEEFEGRKLLAVERGKVNFNV